MSSVLYILVIVDWADQVVIGALQLIVYVDYIYILCWRCELYEWLNKVSIKMARLRKALPIVRRRR